MEKKRESVLFVFDPQKGLFTKDPKINMHLKSVLSNCVKIMPLFDEVIFTIFETNKNSMHAIHHENWGNRFAKGTEDTKFAIEIPKGINHKIFKSDQESKLEEGSELLDYLRDKRKTVDINAVAVGLLSDNAFKSIVYKFWDSKAKLLNDQRKLPVFVQNCWGSKGGEEKRDKDFEEIVKVITKKHIIKDYNQIPDYLKCDSI